MGIKIGLIAVLFISASISFFSSIKLTANAKRFQNIKVDAQTTDSISESTNVNIEKGGIIPNIIPADIYVILKIKALAPIKKFIQMVSYGHQQRHIRASIIM